jgi:[ribosomal protein S5]-alanine N-acetyltransferase
MRLSDEDIVLSAECERQVQSATDSIEGGEDGKGMMQAGEGKDMFALETDRLLMRHLTMDDLDALYVLYQDAEVRRYYPDGIRNYAETKREMNSMIADYGDYGYGLWATIDKASGRFIGRCGLIPWTVDGALEVEVAYLLDKDFWGKGLGFEAAQASMRYGFDVVGLPRIVCMMFAANKGSAAIARKLGMTLHEDMLIEGQPSHKFEIMREAWSAKG